MRDNGFEAMRRTDSRSTAAQQSGDRKFLNFFADRRSAGNLESSPMTVSEARSASREAFSSRGVITRYLKWFSLSRLYRHVLVDRLISDTDRQGFKVELLTPALVHYDEWLFEDVTRTPLSKQIEVMDYVSRRPNRPRGAWPDWL